MCFDLKKTIKDYSLSYNDDGILNEQHSRISKEEMEKQKLAISQVGSNFITNFLEGTNRIYQLICRYTKFKISRPPTNPAFLRKLFNSPGSFMKLWNSAVAKIVNPINSEDAKYRY